MRKLLVTPMLLVFLAPLTLLAGHGEKKACSHNVEECLNKMVTKLKTTGFIGVELDDAAKGGRLLVTEVFPGTPADKGGIKKGDELLALDGIPFNEESHEKMGQVKKPGREVTCTIKRDGASKKLKLTLAPMPADIMAKYIGEHMMSHAKKEPHASAAP